MEYDKEFEEAYDESLKVFSEPISKRYAFAFWQAARKDHYRIGEEVESFGCDGWKLSVITATREGIGFTENQEFVRKIPLKSRIDEIAEEAREKLRDYLFAKDGQQSNVVDDIIKTAILQALEGR